MNSEKKILQSALDNYEPLIFEQGKEGRIGVDLPDIKSNKTKTFINYRYGWILY